MRCGWSVIWRKIPSAPIVGIWPWWSNGWLIETWRWKAFRATICKTYSPSVSRAAIRRPVPRVCWAPCGAFSSICTAKKYVRTIPARCWLRRNCRSGCRKISAKHRLNACCRRRWWISRWSCAIKLCLRYSTRPDCACRNWSAWQWATSACVRAWCGWSVKVIKNAWCRWAKRRSTGWKTGWNMAARGCWTVWRLMCCFPASARSRWPDRPSGIALNIMPS